MGICNSQQFLTVNEPQKYKTIKATHTISCKMNNEKEKYNVFKNLPFF